MRSRFIAVLHGMGCEFALDDFGSGLSSFSTLRTLPMDYLKIDGSFINNLAGDSVNQAMVAAMIELSRSLNFRVVAEQVEDQQSLDTVTDMGIDFVQGFVVGRPQPLSVMPGRAHRRRLGSVMLTRSPSSHGEWPVQHHA